MFTTVVICMGVGLKLQRLCRLSRSCALSLGTSHGTLAASSSATGLSSCSPTWHAPHRQSDIAQAQHFLPPASDHHSHPHTGPSFVRAHALIAHCCAGTYLTPHVMTLILHCYSLLSPALRVVTGAAPLLLNPAACIPQWFYCLLVLLSIYFQPLYFIAYVV